MTDPNDKIERNAVEDQAGGRGPSRDGGVAAGLDHGLNHPIRFDPVAVLPAGEKLINFQSGGVRKNAGSLPDNVR